MEEKQSRQEYREANIGIKGTARLDKRNQVDSVAHKTKLL